MEHGENRAKTGMELPSNIVESVFHSGKSDPASHYCLTCNSEFLTQLTRKSESTKAFATS